MKCFGLHGTIAVVLLLPLPHFPQQRTAKPKATSNTVASKEKSDAKREAERIRKERQDQARSLLISLASDARSFLDQTLRARSFGRIADALWNTDPEQSRTLFRRAWDAAEAANKESEQNLNVLDGVIAVKPQQVSAAASTAASTSDLRKEVLRLVARRDPKLAEEFLEKLKESQPEIRSDNAVPSLWDLPEALQQRLDLVESNLREGSIERSLPLADAVLMNVTISTLDFLTELRAKDPVAADQRYSAMLAGTSSNPTADANTVSLLSSYIFTPNTYVIFNSQGAASYSAMPATSPANVSSELRQAFFQTAGAVLLRREPTGENQSPAGIAGKYMVVKRLLPLFEQYGPREIAALMQNQYEALNALVSDNVRRGETDAIKKGITPEGSFADQESSIIDEVEHANTSDERDGLYFKLALLELRKENLKARDYVFKIEASEFRKQAQAWVDWGLAVSAITKKKTELALDLNRTGELTHIQRVWILTQVAQLLAKTHREKASSLIDAANAEARRIDGGDLDRPRALFAIANALRQVESERVSEAIFEAVKAANSSERFTGEGGMITQTMNTSGMILISPQNVPEFDIAEIFGVLANEDYERAVELARGFQGEAPRANATIAIARSVLNGKGVRPGGR